jgi:hypothetical protein
MNKYLNELKVAVINEDLKKLEELSNKAPQFDSIEEAQEIQAFLKRAINLLQKEKNRLAIDMKKIKDLQKFNNSQKKESFDFKA